MTSTPVFTKKYIFPAVLLCMMLQLAFTNADDSTSKNLRDNLLGQNNMVVTEKKDVNRISSRKLQGLSFGFHTPKCDDQYLRDNIIYAISGDLCYKIDMEAGTGGVWWSKQRFTNQPCNSDRFVNPHSGTAGTLSSFVSLSGGMATFSVPPGQRWGGRAGVIEFVDAPENSVIEENVVNKVYQTTIGIVGCNDSGDTGINPCPGGL